MKPKTTKKSTAFRGLMREHADEIRKWRRSRLTWREITENLQSQYSITVSLQAVQQYFHRYIKSKKYLTIPLGFEPSCASEPKPTRPSKPTPPPDDFSVDITPEPPTPFSRNRKTKNHP